MIFVISAIQLDISLKSAEVKRQHNLRKLILKIENVIIVESMVIGQTIVIQNLIERYLSLNKTTAKKYMHKNTFEHYLFFFN
jgi:hypothetical protein